jgi:ABC-2 type transport system permease protein
MKQWLAFIRKEFYHVFRDRRTLVILFGLPVVQIVLFGFALSSEVKNIGIAVLDNAHDAASEQVTSRIRTSSYFQVRPPLRSYGEIEKRFRDGSIKCTLVFPSDFGAALGREGRVQVQVVADASDPNTATTVVSYLSAILAGYAGELSPTYRASYQIVPQIRFLYNEEQNGSLNFVPGVIALIFMIVATALTSVSIVREKELGTMEILLVSPLKPLMVLVAKAVPYLLLCIVNLVLILLLSVFLLKVEIRGSLLLLFAESVLFIITCLALGLLISNRTNSQQTAMLISMMGMMLPTMLLTGFMFPLENMPWIFRVISYVVPSRYYYEITKAVMLKGLGFGHVWRQTAVLFGMATALLMVALKTFKTRLA